MPPFIPRQRKLSPSIRSDSTSPPVRSSASKAANGLEQNKAFLDSLASDDSDSDSSISDISSAEFEDVDLPPAPKRRKIESDAEDDEEDIEWEDAVQTDAPAPPPGPSSAATRSGDLEITLQRHDDTPALPSSSNKKKGPTKIERQIRLSTHCMHVQFLLFHNLIRNGWICDKEVHKIMLNHLPVAAKHEIEKWRTASGLNPEPPTPSPPAKRKRGQKGKKALHHRNQRDWGHPAERQERGVPNLSRGDPIVRLLKILAAWWKKRFTITATGLRKKGYKPVQALGEEVAAWKKDRNNAEEYGERIGSIQEFRRLAKACEGSRDVGVQLFTALMRAIGIEARLVASLQPLGFGWSKHEEYTERRKGRKAESQDEKVEDTDESDEESDGPPEKPARRKGPTQNGTKRPPRKSKNGPAIVKVDSDSDAQISEHSDDDDDSVIEITPSTNKPRPNATYDRDMPAPTYWTEVISPITQTVFPAEPFMLVPPVATGPDQLIQFEPRGAKADKAKQVLAYIIAFSSDGTAKEVTTRYLKKHMWPGRTKGYRVPVEKVPIYNRRGKIKRHELYDWTKRVLSPYERPHKSRTAADDKEDSTDLKPVQPEKKEPKPGEEMTLQSYKTSAEYVLQRHLRREEALRPTAVPVKSFTSGKGDKNSTEPVFLRSDVEVCRTAESWHKEGRGVKPGEHPMKSVPVRAVTMTRKREIEEAERLAPGEKVMQGMYAHEQTDWIIPPPIVDGVIPKNSYGNMDVFVPTMVPKGAIHIPLRGTVRVCRKLNIDFAEAVTGFEFGHRMAVPVISGVVVAKENEDVVLDQWERDEEERRIKEEGKREKQALGLWRKMIMGLRIVQRFKEEYEDADEDALNAKEERNPFTNASKTKQPPKNHAHHHHRDHSEAHEEDRDGDGGGGGGGFLLDDEPEPEAEKPTQDTKLVISHGNSDNDEDKHSEGNHDEPEMTTPPPVIAQHDKTPESKPASKTTPKSKAKARTKSINKRIAKRIDDNVQESNNSNSNHEQESPDTDGVGKAIGKGKRRSTRTSTGAIPVIKSRYFEGSDSD